MITIADIRKAIQDLPDDAPVVILVRPTGFDGADGGSNMPRVVCAVGINWPGQLEIEVNALPPAP